MEFFIKALLYKINIELYKLLHKLFFIELYKKELFKNYKRKIYIIWDICDTRRNNLIQFYLMPGCNN